MSARYYEIVKPENECPACIAWYAEATRAALLLELLAEDHFPDQESFDAWIGRQMALALRPPATDQP